MGLINTKFKKKKVKLKGTSNVSITYFLIS